MELFEEDDPGATSAEDTSSVAVLLEAVSAEGCPDEGCPEGIEEVNP